MSDKAGAALGKLTTGSQWEIILRSHFPTVGNISCRWEDVCFGLAGVTDPLALLILRVKYVKEDELEHQLGLEILDYVQKLAYSERWLEKQTKTPSNATLRAFQKSLHKLAKLAMYEILAPDVCPDCKGAVVFIGDGKKIVCEKCEGHGHVDYKTRERCRIAGIHPNNWYKTDGDRYKNIYTMLITKEKEALRIIYRRVFKYHIDET